jgi:hypothetical protein
VNKKDYTHFLFLFYRHRRKRTEDVDNLELMQVVVRNGGNTLAAEIIVLTVATAEPETDNWIHAASIAGDPAVNAV